MDALSDFLYTLFYENYLVDISPTPLFPTWNNGRGGMEYIAKRLDRFMVHHSLVECLGNFQSSRTISLLSCSDSRRRSGRGSILSSIGYGWRMLTS